MCSFLESLRTSGFSLPLFKSMKSLWGGTHECERHSEAVHRGILRLCLSYFFLLKMNQRRELT